MRILLLITGLGMGGAEKVVCELADHLYEKGHEINIIYLFGSKIKEPKNSIPIKKIDVNLFTIFFSAPKKLLQEVATFKPDIVHSHMYHANIMARLIKIFNKKIKVVCTSHSNFEGGSSRMFFYALTENLCDVHTSVSENASRVLTKAGAVKNKKIIPICNGINTAKYFFSEESRIKIRNELSIHDSNKVIITVGRIDTPKDYPNLLTAFKKVLEKNDKIILLIVGDGPKKEEILLLSKTLEIDKNILFLGIRNDINDILCASDLFVSSSAWEGFGLAILEAMLCKRMIVSTRTDGAMELLPNSNLVDCGNPHELANKIISYLEYKDTSCEYKNTPQFDWSHVIEKWIKIYEN